jgi:hypothetical protein
LAQAKLKDEEIKEVERKLREKWRLEDQEEEQKQKRKIALMREHLSLIELEIEACKRILRGETT